MTAANVEAVESSNIDINLESLDSYLHIGLSYNRHTYISSNRVEDLKCSLELGAEEQTATVEITRRY